MEISPRILAGCARMGIALPAQAAEQFDRYYALLREWNARMDLTGADAPEDFSDRHVLDSLTPLAVPGLLPPGAHMADIGTGAGFPGLPLAIARPDLSVTLVDALQKRIAFCQAVIDALGLSVEAMHARAEDFARAKRGAFDAVVSRAVSSLPVLLELGAPMLRTGGVVIAFKGPQADTELPQGDRAAALLCMERTGDYAVTIPGQNWQHRLLVYTQQTPAPEKYPRRPGIPEKRPLGGAL